MKARTQTTFEKKWAGCVKVVTGENKAKFTSIQTVGKEGKIKEFPNGETTLTVSLSSLPKAAQRVIRPNVKEPRMFRIRLNEDGDAVETVTPKDGVFQARAIGLGPKTKEGAYKLINKVYNDGKENENRHDEFICIYEITDGPFRGVELPGFYLHYKFEEIPEGEEDEGFTRFNCANTPQASQLHKLINWAEVHGDILEDPIRWPDDGIILEDLEERLLDADRTVSLVFENGWIKMVTPFQSYEEVEDVDDDAAAVDEMLDGDDEVEPVKINSKAPAKKAAPAKVTPKKSADSKSRPAASDDEDDL